MLILSLRLDEFSSKLFIEHVTCVRCLSSGVKDNQTASLHEVDNLWKETAALGVFTLGELGFLEGSDGKESACNEGDLGLIPGSGRSPREGNGYPLQYSCLENCMDRGGWRATVPGIAKNHD